MQDWEGKERPLGRTGQVWPVSSPDLSPLPHEEQGWTGCKDGILRLPAPPQTPLAAGRWGSAATATQFQFDDNCIRLIPWSLGASLFFKVSSSRVINDFPSLKLRLEQNKSTKPEQGNLVQRAGAQICWLRQSEPQGWRANIHHTFLEHFFPPCSFFLSQQLSDLHKHVHKACGSLQKSPFFYVTSDTWLSASSLPKTSPHKALPLVLQLAPSPSTCQTRRQVLPLKGGEENKSPFPPRGCTPCKQQQPDLGAFASPACCFVHRKCWRSGRRGQRLTCGFRWKAGEIHSCPWQPRDQGSSDLSWVLFCVCLFLLSLQTQNAVISQTDQ